MNHQSTCQGCQENQPGQLAHMGPGGCLANNSNSNLNIITPVPPSRVNRFKKNARNLTNRVRSGQRNANFQAQYNRLGAEYELVRNMVADANKEEIDEVFAALHNAVKGSIGGRRRTRPRRARKTRRRRN